MADKRAILYQGGTANVPAIKTAATALALNSNRGAFSIQNLDTNPLFVLLGSGASTTVFHIVLKAGSQANDGTGGTFAMEAGTVYTGIITVASSGTPSYVVTEI